MQMPTPEQVLAQMEEKFGHEGVPNSIRLAQGVAPEMLVEQAMSSKMSMQSDTNALDPKTSLLVYFSAALGMKDQSCIDTLTYAALNAGVSKEELLSVVKIVRHAAFSGIVGAAEDVLKIIKEHEDK
ncbi:carboxymuconolactone decarboxylase family protein [Sulfurimonas paralvinellae]|uniref:Carboxymuconolactone decarboxylase family protein n=1 Tax=Sulfurimonas paralvinellae TaxID=317658 RepID=A0A7M1B7U1_9BACT|nr:carboxymuconolactone decarboxylase family protein [Sulfurimonas paralvinellae]QOP45809.1 carboxymuconolactone decarboxylase family protein [Sulfurimonas paralvinellae]